MKYHTSLLAGCAALMAFTPLASAHGFVNKLVVDGQTYKGAGPGQAAIASPIRQIDDVSPVTSATSPNMICGQGAQVASLVANATAGSKVDLHWVNGDGGNWVHVVGPLMAYIAACENDDCTTDKATSSQWVKLSELGQKTPGTNTWYLNDLHNGQPHTVTLPASLPTGSYLLRTEIIALHNAVSVGGAEFYPSCAQLRITGGESSTKKAVASSLAKSLPSADVTSFPGAYKATDKGLVVDVYDPGFDYSKLFPGPPIPSSFAVSGSNSTSDDDSASSAPVFTASATSSGFRTSSIAIPTGAATSIRSSPLPTTSVFVDPSFTKIPGKHTHSASVAVPTTTLAPSVTTSIFAGRVVVVTTTMTITYNGVSPTASAVAPSSSLAPNEDEGDDDSSDSDDGSYNDSEDDGSDSDSDDGANANEYIALGRIRKARAGALFFRSA